MLSSPTSIIHTSLFTRPYYTLWSHIFTISRLLWDNRHNHIPYSLMAAVSSYENTRPRIKGHMTQQIFLSNHPLGCVSPRRAAAVCLFFCGWVKHKSDLLVSMAIAEIANRLKILFHRFHLLTQARPPAGSHSTAFAVLNWSSHSILSARKSGRVH